MKRYWPCAAFAAITLVFCLLPLVPAHPVFRPSGVHWFATLILFMYLWGLWELLKKKRLLRHVQIMTIGMIMDVSLTFYHEVGLRAISFAVGMEAKRFEGNPSLLRFHIWVSALLLAMYLIVWISGRGLVPRAWHWIQKFTTPRPKSPPEWRGLHRWAGYATVALNAASWASSPYFLLDLTLAQ